MSRGLGRMQLAVLRALSELGGVASPKQLSIHLGDTSKKAQDHVSRALVRLTSLRILSAVSGGYALFNPPLTQGPLWSVYNCKWQAISATTAPDHTITDPPYDQHMHKAAAASVRHSVDRTKSGKRGGADHYLKTTIDFGALDSYDHVPELIRITRRWVLCFCTMEQTAHYQEASGKSWIRAGAFHRTDAAPMFSGDRPGGAVETVAIMHRPGRKKWNGGGKAAFWESATEKRNRVHPTQKPLGLMLELVRLFTDEGDLVFDPYCGSGTTGVACLRLGRRFIGCEIDPKYYAAACERLRAEESGLSVGDVKKGQKSLF